MKLNKYEAKTEHLSSNLINRLIYDVSVGVLTNILYITATKMLEIVFESLK